MTTILKALVGSRAHGLHREDSDWDWRGIYVQPTSEILSLGYNPRTVQWLEGKEDFTNYEIGHFLMLVTKANPAVLELLTSPKVDYPEVNGRKWGKEIGDMWPYLFDAEDAFNAFTGYSLNQRKKLLDDKDGRKWKYALAYIRTLQNLIDIMQFGVMFMEVRTDVYPDRFALLKSIRDGKLTPGDIINIANDLTAQAKSFLPRAMARAGKDLGRINAFLLSVRKSFWGENHE